MSDHGDANDDDYPQSEFSDLVKSYDDISLSYLVSKGIYCSADIYVSADDLEIQKSRGIFRSQRKDIYSSVETEESISSSGDGNNRLDGSLITQSRCDSSKQELEQSFSCGNSCEINSFFQSEAICSNNSSSHTDDKVDEISKEENVLVKVFKDFSIKDDSDNEEKEIEKEKDNEKGGEEGRGGDEYAEYDYDDEDEDDEDGEEEKLVELTNSYNFQNQPLPLQPQPLPLPPQQQLFNIQQSFNINQTQPLFYDINYHNQPQLQPQPQPQPPLDDNINQQIAIANCSIQPLPMNHDDIPIPPLPLGRQIYSQEREEEPRELLLPLLMGERQQKNKSKSTKESLPEIPLPPTPDDIYLSDYNLDGGKFNKEEVYEYIKMNKMYVICNGCGKEIKMIETFGKSDGSYNVCIPCSIFKHEDSDIRNYDWEEVTKSECDGFTKCNRMAHYKRNWSFLERDKQKSQKKDGIPKNKFALKVEKQCLYCRNFKRRQHLQKNIQSGKVDLTL